MATESGVVLEGLEGGTPLGFLAGLGVQRVLAERLTPDTPRPCLCWRALDAWRPVLHGGGSLDSIVDAVHDDACEWEHEPILAFRYAKVEKKGVKPFAGLRSPVAVLRAWLQARREAADERSLAYASALMCETACDALDKPPSLDQLAAHGIDAAPDALLDRATLPTFFDFTSRNAQFLDQVREIRGYLDRDRIEAGLRQGRPDPDAPRTLDWDPAADTPGAIYTGHERGYLPVAEWLAFRGLVCFPATGVGATLHVTGCTGRRKDGALVWPLWQVPAGPDTVRSLVAHPQLADLGSEARAVLGIAAVYRAALSKKADGYSGVFAPPRPV